MAGSWTAQIAAAKRWFSRKLARHRADIDGELDDVAERLDDHERRLLQLEARAGVPPNPVPHE